MLCHKDRIYCSWSDSCLADCHRNLTPEEASKADLPICFSDFRSTDECPGYVTIVEDEDDEA